MRKKASGLKASAEYGKTTPMGEIALVPEKDEVQRETYPVQLSFRIPAYQDQMLDKLVTEIRDSFGSRSRRKKLTKYQALGIMIELCAENAEVRRIFEQKCEEVTE